TAWLRGQPGMTVNLILQNQNTPYNYYARTPAQLSAGWQQFSAADQIDHSRIAHGCELGNTMSEGAMGSLRIVESDSYAHIAGFAAHRASPRTLRRRRMAGYAASHHRNSPAGRRAGFAG